MNVNTNNSADDGIYYPGPEPTNGLGISGFVVSLVGLVTCGLVSPIGLLISLFGLFKRPKGFAVAGTILGLLGSAGLALAGGSFVLALMGLDQAVQEERNRAVAAVNADMNIAVLQRAYDVIKDSADENGNLPDGIDGNKLIVDIEDVNGVSVRYAPLEIDPKTFELQIAGDDGRWDSGDDWIRTYHLDVNGVVNEKRGAPYYTEDRSRSSIEEAESRNSMSDETALDRITAEDEDLHEIPLETVLPSEVSTD